MSHQSFPVSFVSSIGWACREGKITKSLKERKQIEVWKKKRRGREKLTEREQERSEEESNAHKEG